MTKKELLARIEELERKVAELELARMQNPQPWPQLPEPIYPADIWGYRWICGTTPTNPNDRLRTWSGG